MKTNVLPLFLLNNKSNFLKGFLLLAMSGIVAEAQNANSAQGQKTSKIDLAKNIANVKADPKTDFLSDSKEFIEQGDLGSINWTRFYIEGDGYGIIDTVKHPALQEAILFAQLEAETEALNNLTEVLKGTFVEGISNVATMSAGSEENIKLIASLVKSSTTVGVPVFAEGKCKISKRVPLFQNGLAKFMVDDALANNESEYKNPFIYLDTASHKNAKNAYMNAVSQVVLLVDGPYQPAIFPAVTNEDHVVFIDFATGFEAKLKQPPTVRLNAKGVKNLGFRKNTAVLEVQQDKNGNLVWTDSSKEKLVGFKGSGKSLMGMVKAIVVQD